MPKVSDYFKIISGNSLELSELEVDVNGVNFIARGEKNNGVSARVKKIENVPTLQPNTITVACSGSVMESFFQPEEYYTSYHVFCLSPKVEISYNQMLYYCECLRANKYRYNYGRQANKTLASIDIPDIAEIPSWVNTFTLPKKFSNKPLIEKMVSFDTSGWRYFKLSVLFDIKKGKRLTQENQSQGSIPFIGSTEYNNGITNYISNTDFLHSQNVITVTYNGSIAEAFYQSQIFWASDDVNVLYPKFELNNYIALFICTIIKQEKYRFNYGRKWFAERMEESQIKLPVDKNGNPDWQFMEDYIKSLPYSSNL